MKHESNATSGKGKGPESLPTAFLPLEALVIQEADTDSVAGECQSENAPPQYPLEPELLT